MEVGERDGGGAEAEFYLLRETGAGDVGAGYGGVVGVEFEGDELAFGWECAGEADGAVAA